MHVFLTIKTLRWGKGEEMLMRFPNAYWLLGCPDFVTHKIRIL